MLSKLSPLFSHIYKLTKLAHASPYFVGSKLSYPVILTSSGPNGTKYWTTSVTDYVITNSPPWGENLYSPIYIMLT